MIARERSAIRSTRKDNLRMSALMLRLLSLGIAVYSSGLLAESQARPAPAARAPVWEIYAIRYATIDSFPVRALVAGADSTRKLDIAMMFWLLKGSEGRRVLVDAGFYRPKFLDAWKPAAFVSPSEALGDFGVPPDSITDVIVSHVHWDHLDGADLFPEARIWIQRAEYEYYVRDDGTPLQSGIDSLDAMMLSGLRKAGRVTLVDGDAKEILPGVTTYTEAGTRLRRSMSA